MSNCLMSVAGHLGLRAASCFEKGKAGLQLTLFACMVRLSQSACAALALLEPHVSHLRFPLGPQNKNPQYPKGALRILVPAAGHLGLRAALRAVGLEIPTCGWASSRPPAKGKQEHPRGMFLFLVPVAGLEPARCRQRWILSPLRLPIPSHRQKCALIVYNKIKKLASVLFLSPKI